MKYTKKAYLTLTPPATQSGQGRIDGDDIKQLLETLLVRQDEENSPYTTQLVRLKKEIQAIMVDTTLSVTAKVKLLNDRISSYRSMLERSKQQQPTTTTTAAVAPPPTPDTPSVIITPDTTTISSSTPVRPRSTTRPKRLLPTTPISTASPSVTQTPRSTLRDTQEIVNLNKRLLETKRKQLELLKEEQRERDLKKKRKQTPDSGLGDSPVANRVRSRTGQEGTGRRRLSIPSSWKKVRFLRQ